MRIDISIAMIDNSTTQLLNSFNFQIFFLENEGTFNLTLNHYAKGTGQRQDVYKVGDFITFQQDFHGPSTLKAVVQQCKATSDGVSAHEYVLINNR